MKLSKFSILFLLLCSIQAMGQTFLKTTRVVELFLSDAPRPYLKSINYLQTENFYPSLIDELGFRSEIEELEPDVDHLDFMVRTKFNSIKERKAYQRLSNAKISKYQLKQRSFLLGQLAIINKNLVTLYFAKQENQLLKQKTLILSDKKIVYKKMAEKLATVNTDKWLDNEEKLFELRDAISRNDYLISSILIKLNIEKIPDFGDWISLESIRSIVASKLSLDNTISEEINTTERALAQADYELEYAKSQKWFDFVQLKYQNSPKDILRNEFSIGASFHIPLKSSNRLKKNEAYLDILKEESNAAVERKNKFYAVDNLIIEMYSLFEKNERFQQFVREQKLQKTYNAYLKINSITPLQLLSLKNKMIDHAHKELKIKQGIYEAYVAFLEVSGHLVDMPFVNYLSEGNLEIDIPK